ncbi:hypothetical protein QOZ80_7BG0605150 [Eleusine coracana subsp. coracana]|nr:hypothetical protein QOZ80_7BG0605150 [Eleusine coracana subsp. coracana]
MEASLVLLAAAFLLSLLIVLRNSGNKSRARLPPGPPWVPLFGNLLWLRNSAADVEPLLLRLFARYGPVVTLRIGSHLSIFVSDRRLAHAALVGPGGVALSDRPRAAASALLGVTDNIITRADYGATWRLLRRNLVSETLHPSRVRLFAPARAWVRKVLMEKLRESSSSGGNRNVMEAFQYSMFCLLVLMCFGERLDEPAVRAIEDAERAWLLYISRRMTVFFFLPSLTRHLFRGRIDAARALQKRQRDLFVPLINKRRQYKRSSCATSDTTFQHSYVDTLLDVTLPDEKVTGTTRHLTDDEIVALCSEFLNAGTDTTSTGLQWIMAELVKNPAVQAKLRAEIDAASDTTNDNNEVTEEAIPRMPYLKAVILEGLRKHPPGHFVLPHRAAQDMDVGGYRIPKGATVNFMVAEMGRDAEEWARPMAFEPERFLEGGDGVGVDVTGTKGIRMMPFGVGRRICAGLNIAMLHLEYFVANMVREFEWTEAPGHEVSFEEKREFTTVMKHPLRPRLVPRSS